MPPKSYPVLNRRQSAFLQEVHKLGLTTDLALAAAVVEAGEEPIDRACFVNWRKGEGSMPMGVLPVLLDHVDEPGAVLGVLAEPLGLMVVERPDAEHTDERSLVSRALKLADETGAVVGLIRRALEDGHMDAGEANAALGAVEQQQRTLAELRAVLARVAK